MAANQIDASLTFRFSQSGKRDNVVHLTFEEARAFHAELGKIVAPVYHAPTPTIWGSWSSDPAPYRIGYGSGTLDIPCGEIPVTCETDD
jgi:hypothetical protein